jgi:hypothetical protein
VVRRRDPPQPLRRPGADDRAGARAPRRVPPRRRGRPGRGRVARERREGATWAPPRRSLERPAASPAATAPAGPGSAAAPRPPAPAGSR